MSDLTKLQPEIGVYFKDVSLLEQALTQSSYAYENPGLAPVSNERLEFLGDAILGMVVAEELYRNFPHLSEGEMTKFRATLICRETLVHVAETLGLGNYLYLGRGEEASGGRSKPVNLATACEALIAAIFLDQGLATARDFILKQVDTGLRGVGSQGRVRDYKSELQELIQASEQRTPTYHTIATEGPDHDRAFTVEVRLGKTALGRATGKSKKAAEAEAARCALEKLPGNFTR